MTPLSEVAKLNGFSRWSKKEVKGSTKRPCWRGWKIMFQGKAQRRPSIHKAAVNVPVRKGPDH